MKRFLFTIALLIIGVSTVWAGVIYGSHPAVVSDGETYFDNFNRDNSDTIGNFSDGSGYAWNELSGDWDIVSNKCENINSFASQLLITPSPVYSDGTIQVTTNNQSDSVAIIGLIFRYVDASNYYLFWYKQSISSIRLSKNGTGSYLVDVTQSLTNGADYTMKVVCNGSSIKCYLNDILYIDTTDSSFSSGNVGFQTYTNGAGTYDDFSIVLSN